ncbi:2OG-Fe(II) oxygenase [Actinomadura scrupuli]|uniref:2OG-Fe(II) oxygenase n=1 Tax=Actinomadura scrupuli TaxID=559629 RepID=UPI003D99A099
MEVPIRTPFTWHTFDVTAELPAGWRDAVTRTAREHAQDRAVGKPAITSRELPGGADVLISMVDGKEVAEHLPWLTDLYTGRFRDLAQTITDETVETARDPRYGIYLNVQTERHGRFECHVDSNPIEGLLYFTDQPPGSGGTLRVSNSGEVRGTDAVDRDCASIHPVAGHLLFFDARHHTHYVTALTRSDDLRVVAGMNYYLPSAPESARPVDLNERLFGAK